MRRGLGVAAVVLGALLALAGVALMVVLGPDDRVPIGPHAVDAGDQRAVVTAPRVLSWTGLRLTVRAELPDKGPVFVGLGRRLDVSTYLADTRRLEVTTFERPWSVRTKVVDGGANLPASPTALDWWVAGSGGLGGARIDVALPDEPVQLAVLAVGDGTLDGLEVTAGYGIAGGFKLGAGLVLAGLGLAWIGVMAWRGNRLWADDPRRGRPHDDADDVTYVYVDDDGVEHEVSGDELDEYEVVDDGRGRR